MISSFQEFDEKVSLFNNSITFYLKVQAADCFYVNAIIIIQGKN